MSAQANYHSGGNGNGAQAPAANRSVPQRPSGPNTPIVPVPGLYDLAGGNLGELQSAIRNAHPKSQFSVGDRVNVSNDDFVNAVINRFPPGILYRRAADDTHSPGTVVGEKGNLKFIAATSWGIMRLVDRSMQLKRQVRSRDGSKAFSYIPCSNQLGGLILDALRTSSKVRELRMITRCPMYGPGFRLLEPGWNPCGIYFDAPSEVSNLRPLKDLDKIHTLLNDLVADFPFREEDGDGGAANRQNFIGLLLTPLVRLAVDSNVPLHAAIAAQERTGKSKLLGDVFGPIVQGTAMSGQAFPTTDEEMNKVILGLLTSSRSLVLFDNISDRGVNSPSMASLLTSRMFQGRQLGSNVMVESPNHLVITCTGNNLRFSSEMAKRTVPIRLLSLKANPEDRTDFRHPDLEAFVRKSRRTILQALLGMVELWREAGCPHGDVTLGGFEGWARTVGGIMRFCEFDRWATNLKSWRGESDTHAVEFTSFISAWIARFPSEREGQQYLGINDQDWDKGLTAGVLATHADRLGLFKGECDPKGEGKINPTSFQKKVLLRHLDQTVQDGITLVRSESGNNATYRLRSSLQKVVERSPPVPTELWTDPGEQSYCAPDFVEEVPF